MPAAAGAGALAVAGAGTAARAATGRSPVRATTVILSARVFTAAHQGPSAQAVAIGGDGKGLEVRSDAELRCRIGRRTPS